MSARTLAAAAGALLLVLAGAPARPSRASFNARTANPTSLNADTTSNYLHVYAQATDPDGLTGYALRRGTTSPAATGSDDTLSAYLGGVKNTSVTLNRVLTLKTPATLPSGITSLTITATVVADAATGLQPLSAALISAVGSTGGTASVTLGAGAKRQVNLTADTRVTPNGGLYTPSLVLTVSYTGYADDFLNFAIPVKVYDGNGAGP